MALALAFGLAWLVGTWSPLQSALAAGDTAATGGALTLTLRSPADVFAVPTTDDAVSLPLRIEAPPGDRAIELRARRNGHPVLCLPLDAPTVEHTARVELNVGRNALVLEAVSARGAVSRIELAVLRNVPATGDPDLPAAGETAELSGDWRVSGDLLVPADATLVLAAGSVLRFAAGRGLECRGTLRAEGTADRPVWLVGAGWSNVLVAGPNASARFAHTEWRGATGRPNQWRDDRTVAGSHADSPVASAGQGTDGGGLMVLSAAPGPAVAMTDCGFSDCQAMAGSDKDAHGTGGAVFIERSVVELSRCRFERCRAARDGGAVYVFQSAGLRVRDCRFAGNSAGRDGGAITLMLNRQADIARATFVGNTAGRNGGAVNVNRLANGSLDNCRLHRNRALTGGAVLIAGNESARLAACDLQANVATFEGGGALLAGGANATLDDCRIVANRAGTTGGGVTVLDAAPRITGCEVCDNHATPGRAGGVAVRYSPAFSGNRLQRNHLLESNDVSGNHPADIVIETTR